MKNKKASVLLILVAVLAVSYAGIKFLANKTAEKKLNEAAASFVSYAEFTYEKISVDLFGLDVHIKNITLIPVDSRDAITIDKLIIFNIDNKHDVPHFAHIELQGILTGREHNEENWLSRLGYDESLKIDLELDYRFDELEREIHVNRLSYGAGNVGTINISLHLSNFDLDFEHILAPSPSTPDILLHRAELSYRDSTLVSSFLQRKARDENIDIADVVQEITEAINSLIADSGSELTKESLNALKKFIKAPDQLFILIEPAEPVSLERILEFKNLNEALILLNAKAKT